MKKRELLKYLSEQGFPKRIVDAFSKVKREDFLPKELKDYAYENVALPLEGGATISQPYTIAFMLNMLELEGNEDILEIGSGSGYLLALLSRLTKGKVYGLEIIKDLAVESKSLLKKYKNVTVFHMDGSKGFIQKAPFDRIVLSASANKLPSHLYGQLKEKGILAAPVEHSIYQIKRVNGRILRREHEGFVFVPLAEGFVDNYN